MAVSLFFTQPNSGNSRHSLGDGTITSDLNRRWEPYCLSRKVPVNVFLMLSTEERPDPQREIAWHLQNPLDERIALVATTKRSDNLEKGKSIVAFHGNAQIRNAYFGHALLYTNLDPGPVFRDQASSHIGLLWASESATTLTWNLDQFLWAGEKNRSKAGPDSVQAHLVEATAKSVMNDDVFYAPEGCQGRFEPRQLKRGDKAGRPCSASESRIW